MKLKRLDLKAYGHFTDYSFDFYSDTPGLHIIYGSNEAGKSTALRALQGLLYGIPMRTADNFLHDYKKMLIGGSLENSDGQQLTFWRRKKNIGDLLDAEHNIIDPGVLAEFLHGIEEPLFNSLFGIDHETLVSGGRDILEQQGDIGQALFSAGVGLSSLHGIIETMEKECGDLFKPSGSKPELNQAIKFYQTLKKEIRSITLLSHTWKAQRKVFESASSDLEEVEKKKLKLSGELESLKRLQRTLPNLARRAVLQEKLLSLGSFDYLPQDFSSRLQDILAERKQVGQVLGDAQSRKGVLEEKRQATTFRQEILDQSESIDAFHQRLGVQRQAQGDRPDIHDELLRCRAQAETLLNQVAPNLDLSRPDEIRALLGKRQQILTHGNRFAGLDQSLTQAEEDLESLTDGLKEVNEQLETLPEVEDLQELETAILTAQKAGDIDAFLRNIERDANFLLSNIDNDLKALGLWSGTADEFSKLPLPSLETIDTFVDRFRQDEDDKTNNRQQQQLVQDELDRVRQKLVVIRKTGTLATEEELEQARTQRDKGWQLVKRVWLGKESLQDEIRAYAENRELSVAYEDGIRTADDVADHLRSAADRVHQYASLLAEVEKLEGQQQRLLDEEGDITQRDEQLNHEWQKLWETCKVSPLSPREMRSWVVQCQEIRRNLREARQKKAEKQPHLEQRQNLFAALLNGIKSVGKEQSFLTEELSPIFTYSEQLLSELQEIENQHQLLQKDKLELERDLLLARKALSVSQKDMDEWQKQWVESLTGFGLPDDATPDHAVETLDNLSTCLDKSIQVEQFEQRLKEIDHYAEKFDSEAAALVLSIAPELESLPADQAVTKLQAMVKTAGETKSNLAKIDEDVEALDDEIRKAIITQETVDAEIIALHKIARCDNDEALLEIESRFREYQDAKADLKNLEETLFDIADGVSLEALEEQRQAVDPNELPGKIDDLARQIRDDLEPQIKSLAEKKGAAYNELQTMDGSGKAAAMEDEAQQALAKVRRLADRYLRVRLGSLLLKKEIELYRQENQDPILKMASHYFSELTLDAFPGLRSDLDDHGSPILVGICPDGAIKTVEEMSSGTRDQLYLSLRLATLEWRLEKHEPMPFIADDILVNFDDERSAATLKALAELGKKNQVILFTHHQQIVRTVKSLDMGDHVFVHPLSNEPAILQ